MPKIIFIEYDGKRPRRSKLHIRDDACMPPLPTDNRVAGIDGDCGGNCACATCHVYIDPAWVERLGARSASEADMLNLVADLRDTSRLACQIDVDTSLDGLIVTTPESQH